MPDQPDRPNILLIITDQQRGDCLGIDGHPVLQTPNMDWIGASGTFFRRGYAEAPSCIPARRSIMAGQSPVDNQSELVWVVTTLRPNSLFYIAFVAPESEYNGLRTRYEEMLRTVAFY